MHNAVCHVSVPQMPPREARKYLETKGNLVELKEYTRRCRYEVRALGEGRQLFWEGNIGEICWLSGFWLLELEAALCGVDGDGRLHDRLDARFPEG